MYYIILYICIILLIYIFYYWYIYIYIIIYNCIWQLLFFVGPPISFTRHSVPPRRIRGSMGIHGPRLAQGLLQGLDDEAGGIGLHIHFGLAVPGLHHQAGWKAPWRAWRDQKQSFTSGWGGKEARFFPCTKWWQWSCLNRLGSCVVGKVFEFVWLPNGGRLLRSWNRYHICIYIYVYHRLRKIVSSILTQVWKITLICFFWTMLYSMAIT